MRTEGPRKIPLRIEIDGHGTLLTMRDRAEELQGRGGLANAIFLIEHCNDSHASTLQH